MGATVVKVDRKGRLTLPRELREALGLTPGTVCFLRRQDNLLCIARVTDPFDGLAWEAEEEFRRGRTRPLEDVVRDLEAGGDAG